MAGGCHRLLVPPIKTIIAIKKVISCAQPEAKKAAAPSDSDAAISNTLRPVTSTSRQGADRRVAQMQVPLDKRKQHVKRTDDPVGPGMAEPDQKNRSLVFPFQTRQAFNSGDQWGFLMAAKAD